MKTAAMFDVDGTLVDSNDAHAEAWRMALEQCGVDVPFHKVRRLIGMGADHLLPAAADINRDSDVGKRISARHDALFRERFLPHLRAFPHARDLLLELQHRGVELAIATSASKEDLKKLLAIARVDDLVSVQTTADDVDRSKPDADIVTATLSRLSTPHAFMVGDTPYDVESATRAGIASIALRTGGWADDALVGAVAIYDGPGELWRRLNASPLLQRHSPLEKAQDAEHWRG